MNKLKLRKVGQLFIYTIAPVDTKRNQILLKDAVDNKSRRTAVFRGKMQTQAELTNRAAHAKLPLMITFDGEWGAGNASAWYSCLSQIWCSDEFRIIN